MYRSPRKLRNRLNQSHFILFFIFFFFYWSLVYCSGMHHETELGTSTSCPHLMKASLICCREIGQDHNSWRKVGGQLWIVCLISPGQSDLISLQCIRLFCTACLLSPRDWNNSKRKRKETLLSFYWTNLVRQSTIVDNECCHDFMPNWLLFANIRHPVTLYSDSAHYRTAHFVIM